MKEINKLSNSFEETLKDSDLQGVTSDFAETFYDSILNDGILKDIPIIGTIVGLTKSAINLNDRLFLKKIIHFIIEIKDVEPHRREQLISDIEQSDKYKVKVGEKLLYIVDKCEDHISAKYIAKLFTAFLKEEINYSDFLRGSLVIQKIYLEDLEYFINTKKEDIQKTITKYDSIPEIDNHLVNSGLCFMVTDSISVRDQDDYKMSDPYIVDGGDLIIYLTETGEMLKRVFATSL